MPTNNNQNTHMNKGRVTITGPSPMVQQMAQQNYAMKNGGELPMQGAPGGVSTPVAPQPMDMNFFGGNGGATGKFEMPAVATAPDLTPDSKAPDPKYGTGGVQFVNPSGTDKNDLSSLSAALNSAGVSSPSSGREFTADDTKKDGGFFGWIKGLAPKFRPGRRDGETDEEYDMRHTQNMQRLATFADAIRHMGNIVNTYKGGPLQRFNDPTDYLMAGYEKRKAERAKRDALAADQAYKNANLSLKERAAEAQRAYQQAQIKMQNDKFDYKKNRDLIADRKWQTKFEFDVAKDNRDFEHKKLREKIKDGQWQAGYGIKLANLNLSRAKFAHTLAKDAKGGTGGNGYGYATPYGFLSSKNQVSSQQEEQMWNFMIRNGQITKKKLAEYQNAAKGDGSSLGLYGTGKGSTSRARKIIQECIAYGLMDATQKGDNFRKFCTTQLGMGEARIYKTPQNPTTWKRGSMKQGQTGKWSIK